MSINIPLPPPAPPPVETGTRRLPVGASHWSRTYLDEHGIQHTARRAVPVTAAGRVAAHEYECPDCGPASRRWLSATVTTPPACEVHDTNLRLVTGDTPNRGPNLLWRELWDRADERVRVAAATAAVGIAGLVVDYTDMPWWGYAAQTAAIPACIAGSWWLTKLWLTRQAKTTADEVGNARQRRRIAKRARTAAYLAATGTGWITAADIIGLDFTDSRGPMLVAALAGLGVIGGRPYLRWVDARNTRAETSVVETLAEEPAEEPAKESAPPVDDLHQLREYVTSRWEAMIATREGPLPGTMLENITRTVGGWSATVIARANSNLDPERYASDRSLRLLARAYEVGVTMVTITVDPFDANKAFVLVQRTSPIMKTRVWDGTGINPETGRAVVATLDNGDRAEHEFWRPGWGAVMELIAGSTGSGKSEYLNLLLAMERQSGLCVSWVGDPQMGQSLADLRDGVDWFAPTTEEILLMLRTAVQVMYARNVLTARARVEEVRPDGEVVERRVKYREVSEDFPLLTVTVDEAHIPMGDPDHGQEIVKLMGILAKSGRKCNIKLRLITQSPLLSELKSGVLRSQLSSGQVAVFRTVGRLDGGAAWPGPMPGDPAALPATWPDGSTAAGTMYLSGQPPMRARADYAGDLWDLMRRGETKGLEAEVLGAAGSVYAERAARLDAFDAIDPAALLGIAALLDGDDETQRETPKTSGREAVLDYLGQQWQAGNRDPIGFGVIGENVKTVKVRMLTETLKKLVGEGMVEKVGRGEYRLTAAGIEHLGIVEDDE